MSKKNFKTLAPQSIFKGIEFQEQPYATTEKFSIYLPKEKDFVKELIEKDKSNHMKTKSHYDVNLITQSTGAIPKFPKMEAQSPREEIMDNQQESKLKSKLMKNIDAAAQIQDNLDEEQRRPKYLSPQTRSILKKNDAQSLRSKQFDIRASQTTSTNFLQIVFKNAQKEKDLKKLRESLYYDERTKTVPKSTIRNNIIEDIVLDGELIIKKPNLVEAIYKLKGLALLKSHDLNVKPFPGIGKVAFVYNDYHSKSTNNGFSRNFGGVFYTR